MFRVVFRVELTTHSTTNNSRLQPNPELRTRNSELNFRNPKLPTRAQLGRSARYKNLKTVSFPGNSFFMAATYMPCCVSYFLFSPPVL